MKSESDKTTNRTTGKRHSRFRVGPFLARLAAGMFLLILVWSCASVPGLREESVSNHIRVPFVRVLLAESSEAVSVNSDASFAIECLSKGIQTVYYSSQPVYVRNYADGLAVTDSRDQTIQAGVGEVNIIPRGSGTRLRMNDHRYRGIMKVLPHGQGVRLVNVLYIEDYLRGVVPPEIGERNEEEYESVRAQAVAARTYTMANLQQYGKEPYDVRATVSDQLYQGVEVEKKLVDKAVQSTSGYVLMTGESYVEAYYHSTCGGMTDDISQVWDRPAKPYLQPVHDTDCSWSKYYDWKEVFTEPQLRGRLEQYLSSDRGREIRLAPIMDIQVVGHTVGGRVAQLQVRTEDDMHRFYKDRIRWVIGRSSNPDLILPSDRFEVTVSRDGNGRVTAITFQGGGYGHGVGMCQCGAIEKSRRGWAFDSILTHYYTDVEVRKLY